MLKVSEKFRAEYYRTIAFIVGIPPGAFFMNYIVLNEPNFDTWFTIRAIGSLFFIWLFRAISKHSLKILQRAEEEVKE